MVTAAVPHPVDRKRPDSIRTVPCLQTNLFGHDDNRTSLTIPEAMSMALDQYVVKRGDLKTVIAGYPWFLDWGRDTLIVARALVAAGKTDVARSIVKQFAGFEKEGTIPNMIHGADTGNRDTSDAPLWLYTVCADLARAEKAVHFLKWTVRGGRCARY